MKNKILFYYNIYVSSLVEKNGNYSFIYNGNNYYFQFFDRSLEDLDYLYELNQEMINNKINVHRIILTISKNIIVFIDNKPYILLQLANFNNRKININDILSFNYIPNYIRNRLNKSNWSGLWENKIDYFEYQFNQMNKKYPIICESINYYIGMWENAISFFNDNKLRYNSNLFVCHRRVNESDTLNDFYNPLNFLIDHKERDIASYLKSSVISKKGVIVSNYFNNFNPFLLISRLLFPNYYFDLYERIIDSSINEKELIEIINLIPEYEGFLSAVFNYYKNVLIPINWLIKKEN